MEQNKSGNHKSNNNKIANRRLIKSFIKDLKSTDIEKLSQLFFRELFHLDINLKNVFPGNIVVLNRKFSSTLGAFRDVAHLEKITMSLEKLGERHLLKYGAHIEHFDIAKQALFYAFTEHFKEQFTEQLTNAWNEVFDDVVAVMKSAMSKVDRRKIARTVADDEDYDPDFLDKIGGEEIIRRVHQRFYDVIFEHPWLGQFFYGKPKANLILKQTQFMVAAFNGPNNYRGDTPAFVHMHMYITDEMSDLRQQLLKTAILEEGLSALVAERWLKVDDSFRASIVKKSIDECVMKCLGQVPITAKKP